MPRQVNRTPWSAWLVAWVDQIGTTDAIGRIKCPYGSNLSQTDRAQLSTFLRNTYKLRDHVDDLVRQLAGDPREARHEISVSALDRFLDSHPDLGVQHVHVQHVSDGLLFALPAYRPNQEFNGRGLMQFLINLASLWQRSIAEGMPVRGAITVGLATITPDGDLLGPALAHVHQLESKDCKWPRILLGGELFALMNSERAVYRARQDRPDLLLALEDSIRMCLPDHSGKWQLETFDRLLNILEDRGAMGSGTRTLLLAALDYAHDQRSKWLESRKDQAEKWADRWLQVTHSLKQGLARLDQVDTRDQ